MPKGRIVIDRERCKECLLCITACKNTLIITTTDFNTRGYQPVSSRDGEECTGCALCAVTCPEAAIEVWRG